MVKKLKVYIMRGYDKKKRGRVVGTYHMRAYSESGATNQVKKRNKRVMRTRVIHVFTPEGYAKWLRKGSSRKPRRRK